MTTRFAFDGSKIASKNETPEETSIAEPNFSKSERVASRKSDKGVFFGSHPEMRELERLIQQIGASDAPVLIQGETGVGKEVFARELHARSSRAHRRFLKLNCAALPSELVESELFGYEKGAFTGAFQKKFGMFDLADGGTIFLDEIGDMAFGLQAKLLQVLQDHEFQRLGGKEPIRIDVRVIAATHCDLERAISLDRFREDLYYRLNVIGVRVPPLRERKGDILGLADTLLRKHVNSGGPVPVLSLELSKALLAYSWPGNVRELENVMRKLLALNDQDMIARDMARRASGSQERSSGVGDTDRPEPKSTILEQVTQAKRYAEKSAITTALESTQWNRKKAALLLKIDYKALLYKIKTLGIEDKMATLPAKAQTAGGA